MFWSRVDEEVDEEDEDEEEEEEEDDDEDEDEDCWDVDDGEDEYSSWSRLRCLRTSSTELD